MKLGIISLLLVFGAFGHADSNAPAQTCAIEAGFVDCEGVPGVYDPGCQVSCAPHQTAECKPAVGFANFDPNHPGGSGAFQQCTLFNSICECR